MSRYTWIDGFNLTNASLGVRFDDGWDGTVFARNLFDIDIDDPGALFNIDRPEDLRPH